MADLLNEIKNKNLEPLLWRSLMGVEVETQRIDEQGKLSHYPYPETLGNRRFHPNLQTDFGETQTEWITDPFTDDHQLIMELQAIHDVFAHEMAPSDRFWLLSMPPALTHEDRLFVRTHFRRPSYQHYRDYLDGKFGIAHGLTTGVHVNFSLDSELIESLAQIEGCTVVEEGNRLYWHVLQNFLKHRWLVTYLFGASPVAEKGYFRQQPGELANPVRSIRNSDIGFNNGGQTDISYATLDQHVSELQTAIEQGELYAQMEFYGPVRIKGQAHLSDSETKGIKYLEFRVFDTNPFVPLGIDERQVDFIRALLTYSLVEAIDPTTITTDLAEAAQLNNVVATQHPKAKLPNEIPAKKLMHIMKDMIESLEESPKLIQAIQFYTTQLDHPGDTIAAKLTEQLRDGSLTDMMLALANQRHNDFTKAESVLQLPGLTPEMQALLAAGLKLGLQVTWPSFSDSDVEFRSDQKAQRDQPAGLTVAANVKMLNDVFPELNSD